MTDSGKLVTWGLLGFIAWELWRRQAGAPGGAGGAGGQGGSQYGPGTQGIDAIPQWIRQYSRLVNAQTQNLNYNDPNVYDYFQAPPSIFCMGVGGPGISVQSFADPGPGALPSATFGGPTIIQGGY
jgi:hypothetical protein